ncbi:zinc ribbon domain protein [bacterium BMS3Abin07]|nr:zinc ribbon domain protein [bacterium BMS3Abin07]GBE31519.1 zinc ribbon domain protein [bacterium BMS3Bbin05]HDL20633.1 zinc ribbon domain-containing protein [Nitrospirota bacterium]HDO21234.1 zinc ribbon domain-containing protein [Nitrospirota bacterium]HDZ87171.1 zinc ribbon domain-containing protein [Nitrospirota bacterium]
MPIYEYICNKCGRQFSILQSVGSTEKDTRCSECGSDKVQKVISAFSCCSAMSQDSSTGSSFSGGT